MTDREAGHVDRMRNDLDEPRTIRRGPRVYTADPGQVIDVFRVDVGVLAARGFSTVSRRDDRSERPDTRQGDGLEDLTVRQLQEIARERDLPGRSTLNRDELIVALRDHEE